MQLNASAPGRWEVAHPLSRGGSPLLVPPSAVALPEQQQQLRPATAESPMGRRHRGPSRQGHRPAHRRPKSRGASADNRLRVSRLSQGGSRFPGLTSDPWLGGAPRDVRQPYRGQPLFDLLTAHNKAPTGFLPQQSQARMSATLPANLQVVHQAVARYLLEFERDCHTRLHHVQRTKQRSTAVEAARTLRLVMHADNAGSNTATEKRQLEEELLALRLRVSTDAGRRPRSSSIHHRPGSAALIETAVSAARPTADVKWQLTQALMRVEGMIAKWLQRYQRTYGMVFGDPGDGGENDRKRIAQEKHNRHLFLAIAEDNESGVRQAVSAGADVDAATNVHGQTALEAAVSQRMLRATFAVLDCTASSTGELTPADLARLAAPSSGKSAPQSDELEAAVFEMIEMAGGQFVPLNWSSEQSSVDPLRMLGPILKQYVSTTLAWVRPPNSAEWNILKRHTKLAQITRFMKQTVRHEVNVRQSARQRLMADARQARHAQIAREAEQAERRRSTELLQRRRSRQQTRKDNSRGEASMIDPNEIGETMAKAEPVPDSTKTPHAAVTSGPLESETARPEASAQPEALAEPESEPETSTEPDRELEASAEPESEPKASTEPGIEAEAVAEPVASTEPEREPEASAELESALEASTEPESAPEASVEPESEPQSHGSSIAAASAEPESEPEASVEPERELVQLETKAKADAVRLDVEAGGEIVIATAAEPVGEVDCLLDETKNDSQSETVDQADLRKGLSTECLRFAKQLFDVLDVNQDGFIDEDEFLEKARQLKNPRLGQFQREDFHFMDGEGDSDGRVSWTEWCDGMALIGSDVSEEEFAAEMREMLQAAELSSVGTPELLEGSSTVQ